MLLYDIYDSSERNNSAALLLFSDSKKNGLGQIIVCLVGHPIYSLGCQNSLNSFHLWLWSFAQYHERCPPDVYSTNGLVARLMCWHVNDCCVPLSRRSCYSACSLSVSINMTSSLSLRPLFSCRETLNCLQCNRSSLPLMFNNQKELLVYYWMCAL